MEVSADIRALVDYACDCGLIDCEDRVWAYNTILEAIGVTGPEPGSEWTLADEYRFPCMTADPDPFCDDDEVIIADEDEEEGRPDFDLDGVLARLSEVAVAAGVTDDTASGRDRASMRIMGILMPRPSQVTLLFEEALRSLNARVATDWFYRLCCDSGYVRRSAIARNIAWNAATPWGELEITINRSKPEKDPREIAAAGARATSGEVYPACQLCVENEGYPGRGAAAEGGAHPARQNLRIVPIELDGDRWGLQYSPYAYFNEHCIAMSAHHRHMHIDRAALRCLLDFVDLVPHYFIGSNADLPIVGGSILSHDHFQGGDHEFPMMRAKVASTFAFADEGGQARFPGVTGAVLEWPLSVLRLQSSGREELLEAAVHVIDSWRAYSDESVGVVAHDADGTPHNTVTPVVRRTPDGGYEVYLALRCNIATDEHPLGVFHPHAEWHHIKKENIGLIEVMGLAILPPRLVDELAAVRSHLLAGELGALEADPLSASHAAWVREVAEKHPELGEDSAEAIIRQEVGVVFGHVLEDAGVFKWDEAGRAAQQRFIDVL